MTFSRRRFLLGASTAAGSLLLSSRSDTIFAQGLSATVESFAARPEGIRGQLICNPLDLPYRVQLLVENDTANLFREGADPSVILYRDRFYLFVSMCGGFWHSPDLVNWEFLATPQLPIYDYAPSVSEIDGQLVMCASRDSAPGSFYRSDDPLSGHWQEIPGVLTFWDPHLFQDDDGRVFIYYGSGVVFGVELHRQNFRTLGTPQLIITGAPAAHGWEQPSKDWNPAEGQSSMPYIEGAWMVKRNGLYYLQYAGPGTEYNGYSDGYYLGRSPLGPFAYSKQSPFSSKPGGFLPGAGHGSSFQDRFGNWWHAATMQISVHTFWERRIGLFPAAFDEDGNFHVNQEFADCPLIVPNQPARPEELTGSLMLLSAFAPASASSSAIDHPPQLAVNEDAKTWWKAATTAAGEFLQVALAPGAAISAIQVNLMEDPDPAVIPLPDPVKADADGLRETLVEDVIQPFTLSGSHDGQHWELIRDASRDGRPDFFLVLERPLFYRYIRVTGGRQPFQSPFAVNGLRVFGNARGRLPAAVTQVSAVRSGATVADIAWAAAPSACGYNIRYGRQAERLYHCWQLDAGHTHLTLRSLNKGADYWVAVDAFNGSGVTPGEPVPIV